MTEIIVLQDGVEKKMTLEEFFESYWGLFRNQVIKVIDDELIANSKLRERIRNA
jgi:hypothetical protein